VFSHKKVFSKVLFKHFSDQIGCRMFACSLLDW